MNHAARKLSGPSRHRGEELREHGAIVVRGIAIMHSARLVDSAHHLPYANDIHRSHL
jgi:hypothetical protein